MLKILLDNHYFFDIIIIINSYPKSLLDLIKSIVKQSDLLGITKYQIILLNNNHGIKVINLCLDIVNNYQNKECQIEIININKNQTINEIYNELLSLTKGEILVFTEANCYPDDNWLENIIKLFSKPNINIVAGEIYQVKIDNIVIKILNLIDKIINKNKLKWSNIFGGQIANIALKKEFIKQQKHLNLTKVKEKEISFYYRILREVEAEIIYTSSAIVYQITDVTQP